MSKTQLAKDAGYVSVEKLRSFSFPGIIGGSTYTLQGRMYLRCNEALPPETLLGFFKHSVGVAKAVFGFSPT